MTNNNDPAIMYDIKLE